MSVRHARTRGLLGLPLVLAIAAGCVGANQPMSPSAASSGGQVSGRTPASTDTTPSPVLSPQTFAAAPAEASTSPIALPSLPLPVGWRSAFLPGLDWGPVLAVSSGQLFMAGMDSARNAVLWRSADGLSWKQLPNPGIAKDFVDRDMTADGNGALILVGELTPSESPVPQIWRSSNGETFAQATLEPYADPTKLPAGTSTAGEIVGVAVAGGRYVAFGDHQLASLDKAVGDQRFLDAWHSSDGIVWRHVELPASAGFDARSITAWRGGFAALASGGPQNHDAIWLSADGVTWQKSADIAQFSTGPILALPDRLVVLGYAETAATGTAPAAWRSSDGRTWTQSLAPFDGVGVMLDGGVVVGRRLIVYGMSHVGTPRDDQSGATPTPASAVSTASMSPIPTARPSYKVMGPTFWVSDDGSSWRNAGTAPYYQFYSSDIASLNGHLVAATRWPGGVVVAVGDVPQ